MSKIDDVLKRRASIETDPEHQTEIKVAQAELQSIRDALERWRSGRVSPMHAVMVIIRVVRDDV